MHYQQPEIFSIVFGAAGVMERSGWHEPNTHFDDIWQLDPPTNKSVSVMTKVKCF